MPLQGLGTRKTRYSHRHIRFGSAGQMRDEWIQLSRTASGKTSAKQLCENVLVYRTTDIEWDRENQQASGIDNQGRLWIAYEVTQ